MTNGTSGEPETQTVVAKDKVVKIINSMIQKVGSSEIVSKDVVYAELIEMQKIIEDARKEIGIARPGDISEKHIPTATDELDAIIDATAAATGNIMDACEVIETLSSSTSVQEDVVNEITKIYEACSFQDITGQRISKVIKTLSIIEDKVGKLMDVMSHQMPGSGDSEDEGGDGDGDGDGRTGDAALLNGPQMAGEAITQDDIDKLLADFD